MIEVTGDYWEYCHQNYKTLDAMVFTSNCELDKNNKLIMGAGIAVAFKTKFPQLPLFYGDAIKNYNKRNSSNSYIRKPNCLIYSCPNKQNRVISIVAFPTKYKWIEDSDVGLIVRSSLQLSYLADIHNWEQVIMTRPGCGLGNLKWDFVKKQISHFFDDRFIIINKD